MAELIIQLRCDPATGKRDIVVKLHSDDDALPIEHEQLHRKLVEKLIGSGALKESETGRLIVERDAEPQAPRAAAEPEPPRPTVSEPN